MLPSPWPPRRHELPDSPLRPPYLADPPPIIDIDLGRQLFVDDFLIEESSLHRRFHGATYHRGNPVLAPTSAWEQRDPHAEVTGTRPSPSAMPFSDGVFFDPADRLFKMWYMAGYQQYTALALSADGIAWDRPAFDIVRGSNVVMTDRRDSSTVWLDLEANNPAARYKMATYTLDDRALRLHTSPDGIHWRRWHVPGPSGDRTTFFHNPFRNVWVFSLRGEDASGLHRFRRYVEADDFASTRWTAEQAALWTGADKRDVIREDLATRPELYNLDAVAYESVMLGLFTMYRGERPEREKPNDVCLGFSRDGFHWSRLSREPFLAVSDQPGEWNWGNVQSAGGGCLVVGDRLYFYVSGREGVPGTSMPGVCSTGLATLRRDGFASVGDDWPSGVPRPLRSPAATLTTRPLRFSGNHLFVNAVANQALTVEVLDRDGRVIPPFAKEQCLPVKGDATRHAVRWQAGASLAELSGEIVRFRFSLSGTRLFAFWVSASATGESRGYLGAGGPGYSSARDVT